MILIGHRGAAGIEPENTLRGIEAAAQLGVDMIEIDLQVTKDDHLVLFHDPNLIRISGVNKTIGSMTLEEVNITTTKSGHPIPTIEEALEAAADIPMLLDCKGKGWSNALIRELANHTGPTPSVTSMDTTEMAVFAKARPDINTYTSELVRPFEAIYKTGLLQFTGISLNFWVLSPAVYWYARRSNLRFMIFTINHVALARFMHFLYPSAAIITNKPDKLMSVKLKCKNKNHNWL